jgi:hypothetical protein
MTVSADEEGRINASVPSSQYVPHARAQSPASERPRIHPSAGSPRCREGTEVEDADPPSITELLRELFRVQQQRADIYSRMKQCVPLLAVAPAASEQAALAGLAGPRQLSEWYTTQGRRSSVSPRALSGATLSLTKRRRGGGGGAGL